MRRVAMHRRVALRRGVGTFALMRRELALGPAALLLATLAAIAVFAVALAPRALDRIGDAELRHRLDDASVLTLDMTGTGRLGLPDDQGAGASASALAGSADTAIRSLSDRFDEPLRSAIGDAAWLVRTSASDLDPAGDRPRTRLSLVVDLEWAERVQFIDGEAPAAWTGSELWTGVELDGAQPPIEIAISAGAAETLGLSVGDELLDQGQGRTLHVAGVYEATDPADRYWTHTLDLGEPLVEGQPGSAPIVRLGAFVDPDSLAGLQAAFSNGPLTAWLPVDSSRLHYADLALLAQQARKALTSASSLPFGGSLAFRTGLADELDLVGARVVSLSGLLALCVSGLAGVLIAVLALAIRTVLDRHAGALRLAVARGASRTQVRLAMLGLGALICVPAAALAVSVAALALPARIDLAGWAAPVAVAAVPIALFGVLVSPSPSGTRRDLTARGGGRARLVAEFALVALAVVAVVILSRRGLAAPSAEVGIDPLLSATPLLLAVAAATLVLRLYPVPLAGVRRALRRRDGAVGMLGAARAERDPALGHLVALALIVGIAVVVATTVLASTVRDGLTQAARETVAADVQVSAPDLGADVIAGIRRVPGVATVAPLVIELGAPFRQGVDDGGVLLVVADTAALHAVMGDFPVLAPGGGSAVPVLASDDWNEQLADDDLRIGDADVELAGSVATDVLPGVWDHWLLVDTRDAAELGLDLPDAERVLIGVEPSASLAVVAAEIDEVVTDAQPGDAETVGVVVVRDVDSTLTAARTPVIASLESGLLGVAVASLALTMLAVLLATVAAAATRNRLIGVLRILGMSRRQIRGLLAWELGPLAIAAVVAGTLLGLALPVVVTTALDLRTFVGGREQPGAVVDVAAVLVSIGAFAAAVLLAGAIAVVLGRRLAPAGAIKMGEP
jgi:putative ABC transport system permease protein